ncbi:MAG: DUF5009 domain-containing protein [Kangiellaceae bacterium]|nr:DUF5009 domain-containing protein [Kangiellaceae bacterium]MCW9017847.1 DUF5009 domain-containing protein [Kangiellaceae bacterium]
MTEQDDKKRILSIDALRGFDMIWILGAEGIFAALFLVTGFSFFDTLARQFVHSEWHGLTFYDLIFPLFIFLSGATLGISKLATNNLGAIQKKSLYLKALKRLALLCLLGVIYNHGWGQGMPADPSQIRYASVLMRIGLAWFFTALIVWHFSPKIQTSIFVIILFLYWLLQTMIPLPSGTSASLTIDGSWNSWFDQSFLPGISYRGLATDPEGILSTLPAICNGLAGAYFGRILKSQKMDKYRVFYRMLVVSSLAVALGYFWSVSYPLNKSLWTGSFTLASIGWSGVLLSVFYWLFDLNKFNRTASFFAVIGVNAIVLYLLTSLFNWNYFVESLFGGIFKIFGTNWNNFLLVITLVFVQWLLAYFLFKKKLFFKV